MKKLLLLTLLFTGIINLSYAQHSYLKHFFNKYKDGDSTYSLTILEPAKHLHLKLSSESIDEQDDDEQEGFRRYLQKIKGLKIIIARKARQPLPFAAISRLNERMAKDGFKEFISYKKDGNSIRVMCKGKKGIINDVVLSATEKEKGFAFVYCRGAFSQNDIESLQHIIQSNSSRFLSR